MSGFDNVQNRKRKGNFSLIDRIRLIDGWFYGLVLTRDKFYFRLSEKIIAKHDLTVLKFKKLFFIFHKIWAFSVPTS